MTDTNTATVATLEVNVKVIKIGKKQCTLAVFRQLDERHWQPDLGTLWGRVSYCPDRCNYRECLNLVWSDGANLYRSHIVKPYVLVRPSDEYVPLERPSKELDGHHVGGGLTGKWMSYAEIQALPQEPGNTFRDYILKRVDERRDAWRVRAAAHRQEWEVSHREYAAHVQHRQQWQAFRALDLLFIAV